MERKTPQTKGAKMGSTAIALVLSAMTIHLGTPVIPAQASISPQESTGLARNYQIPAGSMDTALNAFADRSGLHVVFDAKLTERLNASGLSGVYSVEEGLDQLLAGTGLSYRLSENGRAVSIILAQADNGTMSDASAPGAEPLPQIDIGSASPQPPGSGSGSGSGQGSADGKNALGGRLTGYNAVNATSAMKMDTPIMQTPVAVQVVTRQTMDDQQAISVIDAITTNASSVQPYPSYSEEYKVRGFTSWVYRDGLQQWGTINLDTSNVQSIEVLKGPAAILYGRLEPGGLVDVVIKRPLETPYYSVQEQVNSYGLARTTVDATGPLNSDHSLLYRFNGDYYREELFPRLRRRSPSVSRADNPVASDRAIPDERRFRISAQSLRRRLSAFPCGRRRAGAEFRSAAICSSQPPSRIRPASSIGSSSHTTGNGTSCPIGV